MANCFGDGKCIWRARNGYYKPFKCPYHCKLVICGMCNISKMPKWILTKYGKCMNCQKILYNEKMMDKLFQNKKCHNKIEF